MKVLVACEESQRVCMAFRAKGHEAYSADIQEPSGGHPEWHILGDVTEILTPNDVHKRGIIFHTMDGERHAFFGKWDLIIAHPPCTYLSFAGNRALRDDTTGERKLKLDAAAAFFLKFTTPAQYGTKVCIENPLGWMNKYFRPADQIIHPFYFADPEDKENFVKKRTCLWLFGLSPLKYNKPRTEPNALWCETRKHSSDEARRKERSKTFTVIAQAMAEQWG